VVGWTVSELAERLGLKPQTISGWIKAGLVTPEGWRAGRPGYIVGLTGMMELITAAQMREEGLSTGRIKLAVDRLRQITGSRHPLANLKLIVLGNDVLWELPEQAEKIVISALHSPGQRVMVFQIGDDYQNLLQALEAGQRAEQEECAGVLV
jgi:DNA-binding transcriptional MerR regulator